ncbi:MAG: YceI family protein [Armatimonadota bacterium]
MPFAPQRSADTAGTWNADTAHGQIGFAIKHLVITTVRGRFTDYVGTVTVDPAGFGKSKVEFTVQSASIDTGQKQRDDHLRSPDFLDTAKFPTLTFKSTKVVRKGDAFVAEGPLSLHGVVRTVSVPFAVTKPVKGMMGETRVGLSAKFPISRKAFGLTWNKLVEGSAVVADTVDIELDLAFTKAK